MKLFNEKNLLDHYIQSRKQYIKKEIEGYTIEKFKTYKIDTLKEYLISTNQISDIPEIDVDSLSMEKSRETRREHYDRNEFSYRYEQSFNVDYLVIHCSISYLGNSKWFEYRPNLYMSVERVLEVDSYENGTVKYHFDLNLGRLQNITDKDNEIRNRANETIQCINKFLESMRKDVEAYNKSLDDYIGRLLNAKYKTEKEIFDTINSINIPLKQKKDTSNITPIKLIPKIEKKLSEPKKDKVGELVEEYSISDKDYNNIINIVHLVSVMMEKAAFTFGKLEEESIRDVVLVALNSHYENMVTGETFRKRGKTDILIEFENQNAYIGECKIWHGEAQIEPAINQLLAYCTWRDTKCSLIYYCKNKKFTDVLKTVKEFLKNKYSTKIISSKELKPNMWECEVKGDNSIIKMNLSIYNLYAKENIKA